MDLKGRFLQKLLLGIALATVLIASFLGYLRPAFVLDLANRLIMCF